MFAPLRPDAAEPTPLYRAVSGLPYQSACVL